MTTKAVKKIYNRNKTDFITLQFIQINLVNFSGFALGVREAGIP